MSRAWLYRASEEAVLGLDKGDGVGVVWQLFVLAKPCLIFARNDEAEHLEKTDGIGGVWLVYDDEWGACGIEVDNVSHELRERIFVFVSLSWLFAIQIVLSYVAAADGFLAVFYAFYVYGIVFYHFAPNVLFFLPLFFIDNVVCNDRDCGNEKGIFWGILVIEKAHCSDCELCGHIILAEELDHRVLECRRVEGWGFEAFFFKNVLCSDKFGY